MSDLPFLISLPTTDRKTAFEFYGAGMGFRPEGEPDENGIPEPLQFALNENTRIVLVPTVGLDWITDDRQPAPAGLSECMLLLPRRPERRSRAEVPRCPVRLIATATVRGSEAMLIYSMSVSVDGFITDREGAFAWTTPSEEQFRFHIEQVRELGGHLCGRRLYETMLPWETDPSMRDTEPGAAFADLWCAIPKVVFSRTLDSVQGNARLAEASLAEEVAVALDATDKDVAVGGAGLAAAAIELGLVDELRVFRYPVVVGGGTPFLPPVTEPVPLELIETRTVGSRVIYERYGRARDESV